MVRLGHLFKSIQKKNILVAGDLLLDRYTFGRTKRISPEAPVPVLLVEREDDRPGGSANVVLNLKALGMNPLPLGVVGADSAGRTITSLLQKGDIDTKAIFEDSTFLTPLKNRIISLSQQMMRVDYERVNVLSKEIEDKILLEIPALVKSADLVALSDYSKGFLTDKIINKLVEQANKYAVPVICDPKGARFEKYHGATILKPNLSEACAAAGLPHTAPLTDIAAAIFKKVDIQILMITRSEAGISLYFPDGCFADYTLRTAREVRDVTGAGDTVLAMLAAALANKLSIGEATELANMAATVAVERLGCANVALSEVARRVIEGETGAKIFTDDNIFALEQALQNQKYSILHVGPLREITAELIKTISNLVSEDRELVVVVASADDDTVQLLSSIKDVHYILHTKNSPGLSSVLSTPDVVCKYCLS